jgi:uncharacterized protein
VIAVDTNILVYAHRLDSPFNEAARSRMTELAEGTADWGIPWPCLHEFLAVVTHPRIYTPPTPLARAIDQVEAWVESPMLVVLSEGPTHWAVLRALLADGRITGGQVHDARIAALCRQHGVRELWSADRDFTRFSGINVTNPLIAG